MQIEIKPEDIDNIVKQAILQSAVGKTIEEAIKKALTGYDNPVDKAIKELVGTFARQLIDEKYRAAVTVLVAEHIGFGP